MKLGILILVYSLKQTVQEECKIGTKGLFLKKVIDFGAENNLNKKPTVSPEVFECGRKQSCDLMVEYKDSNKFQAISATEEMTITDRPVAFWEVLGRPPINEWIVIQRRIDGSINFNRGWADYKSGFGTADGNMWLGLDKIHMLAAPGKRAMLQITMTHWSNASKHYVANYKTFEVENEANGYRIKVEGYYGDAGSSMSYSNGMKFSTVDKDNDEASWSCASAWQGGWWFNACHSAFLNGIYPTMDTNDAKYISWRGIDGQFGKITTSEIKIKFDEGQCI